MSAVNQAEPNRSLRAMRASLCRGRRSTRPPQSPGSWFSASRIPPLWLTLTLLLLTCSPVGFATTFRIRYVTSKGIKLLYMRDVARYYGMGFEAGTTRVRLRSQYSDLAFTVGRCEATVNGVQVHLSDPLQVQKAEPLIADHDFRLLLDPILRAKTLKRKQVKRILIDPGHGGKDPGAMGKTYREKDINLSVAKKLMTVLKAEGYTVTLTRSRDTAVSLSMRVDKAKSWKPDIMLSIHCNSVGAASVSGVEVFRATPEGACSTYGARRATSECENNAWDVDNARLAYEMQKRITDATRAEDRGVKSGRFVVLTGSPCPAVLVEMGFLTNSEEERRLGSDAYQTNLVRGLADGIVRYTRCIQAN